MTSTVKVQQLTTKPWAPNNPYTKPDVINAEKTNKSKNLSNYEP